MIFLKVTHVSTLLIPLAARVNGHVIIIKHVNTSHSAAGSDASALAVPIMTHLPLRSANTKGLHLLPKSETARGTVVWVSLFCWQRAAAVDEHSILKILLI